MTKSKAIKPAIVAYIAFVLFGSLVSIINSNFNILAAHFNKDLSSISLMISAMAVGRLSTIFISGVISDKIGRKLIIAVSIVCLVVCYALIPMTTNFVIGMALITLAGMGHGMVDSTATALIFDCFPQKPGVPIGIIQVFFCFGAMSTPVITSVLINSELFFGWLFWGLSFIGVIAVLWLCVVKFPPKSTGEEISPEAPAYNTQPRIMREGLLIAVIMLCYSLVTTTITTWSGTYAYEVIGATELVSIQILSYYNIGCMVGTIIISRLLAKYHASIFLIVNFVGIFIMTILLTMIKTPQIIFAFYVVFGLFAGINYSLALTIVGEMFPKRKGTAAGAIMGMSALGAIITPVISGAVYKNYGIITTFTSIFYVCMLMVILTVIFRIRYVNITKGQAAKNIN